MKDLLGLKLTANEAAILTTYHDLKVLVSREDLAPCAAANLRHALGYVAVAAADLGLVFEHLLDHQV